MTAPRIGVRPPALDKFGSRVRSPSHQRGTDRAEPGQWHQPVVIAPRIGVRPPGFDTFGSDRASCSRSSNPKLATRKPAIQFRLAGSESTFRPANGGPTPMHREAFELGEPGDGGSQDANIGHAHHAERLHLEEHAHVHGRGKAGRA